MATPHNSAGRRISVVWCKAPVRRGLVLAPRRRRAGIVRTASAGHVIMGCAQSSDLPVADKLEHLKKTPFLLYLEAADLEALAAVFVAKRMVPGLEVPESAFYFLVDGAVAVTIQRDGKPQKISTKPEGSFFSRNFRDVTEASKRAKQEPKWLRDAMTTMVADTAGTVLIVPPPALKTFMNLSLIHI
eukprot:6966086-Prymnesium_polylepis.1